MKMKNEMELVFIIVLVIGLKINTIGSSVGDEHPYPEVRYGKGRVEVVYEKCKGNIEQLKEYIDSFWYWQVLWPDEEMVRRCKWELDLDRNDFVSEFKKEYERLRMSSYQVFQQLPFTVFVATYGWMNRILKEEWVPVVEDLPKIEVLALGCGSVVITNIDDFLKKEALTLGYNDVGVSNGYDCIRLRYKVNGYTIQICSIRAAMTVVIYKEDGKWFEEGFSKGKVMGVVSNNIDRFLRDADMIKRIVFERVEKKGEGYLYYKKTLLHSKWWEGVSWWIDYNSLIFFISEGIGVRAHVFHPSQKWFK